MHEFQESAIVNNWYTWSEWITADELMRFRFSENIFGRFIDLFTCKSAFWKKIRNRGICIWLSGNGTDPKKKLKP